MRANCRRQRAGARGYGQVRLGRKVLGDYRHSRTDQGKPHRGQRTRQGGLYSVLCDQTASNRERMEAATWLAGRGFSSLIDPIRPNKYGIASMKNYVKRFVVIWIVLAIAWLIGKMVSGYPVRFVYGRRTRSQ